MQIGIDLGATKIEYVLLDKKNKEIIRSRIPTPNNYEDALLSIISIIKDWRIHCFTQKDKRI